MKENLRKIKIVIKNKLQENKISKSEKKNKHNEQSKLEMNILLMIHALEKGMGIKNPRNGYGKEKAMLLIGYLKTYQEKGYDCKKYVFQEAVSMLKTYLELMHEQNVDVDRIENDFNDLKPFIKDGKEALSTGFEWLTKETLLQGMDCNAKKLFETRHSMRSYSKDVITDEEIFEAITLANMAPSACNRQPTQIYCTKDQETAHKFEKLIAGSQSFEGETPYFMVVTVDRACFMSDEYLQWYVNGGIYLGFLTLALHSCGIGSIIMQWKFANQYEDAVRKLIGMPQNEAIVAILGYGHYDDETKCIYAQRKTTEEVITKF